ncbi:16S/23S rRNA (cytidine-2'-O)-methyltransferase TlyA [compost metagenome]
MKIILPPLIALLERPADIAALIKPQFEAGREKVGKSGVVREPAVHKEVLVGVLGMASGLGYRLEGLTFSPITGGEGNIEFLAHWKLLPEAAESGTSQPEQSPEEHEAEDFAALADTVIKEATATFKVSNPGNSSRR